RPGDRDDQDPPPHGHRPEGPARHRMVRPPKNTTAVEPHRSAMSKNDNTPSCPRSLSVSPADAGMDPPRRAWGPAGKCEPRRRGDGPASARLGTGWEE